MVIYQFGKLLVECFHTFSSQPCQLTDSIELRNTHSFATPPTVALMVLRRTLALTFTAHLPRV